MRNRTVVELRFQDLFAEPARVGLRRGLTSGTQSLLRHVVIGFGDGIGQLTGTMGWTLAVLSLDNDFVEQRQFTSRDTTQTRTAPSRVQNGILDFAAAVYGGVTGVVEKSVSGLHQSGATGFVKGAFRVVVALGLHVTDVCCSHRVLGNVLCHVM